MTGSEFSRSAHEWFALLVFVEAGGFADEHDAGMWISHAEHHLRPAQFCQFALLTVMKRFAEFLKRHDEHINGEAS